MSDRYERVQVESRAELRRRPAKNHATSPGIWLATFKKANPDRYVAYGEIVEEALCVGWVDSLPRKLDETRSLLLLTPRKPGSNWSRANKERVERLTAAGLMTQAGLIAVESARTDGSWSALDAVEELSEPEDLRAALDADPVARRRWDAFPRSAKRGILEWIGKAKREETRAKRVRETVTLAAQGIRANQWRQPKSSGG
jgi:uncharacterized protein YdeI (YjbR/CyaY-like superfamily)